MALNTQFPDWLRQDTRDATGAGIAIGRNMLEGLRLRQQQEQFQAEQPIRQAQVAVAQEQYKGLVNQNNLAAIEAARKQRETGLMAKALAFEEDIAGSPNGYNPENQARFYSLLKENIDLLTTPWAASMEEKFKNFSTMALKTQKLENDLAIASAKAEADKARADATATVNESRLANADERLRLAQEDAARKDAKIKADEAQSLEDAKPFEQLLAEGKTPEESRALMAQRKGGWRVGQADVFISGLKQALKPSGGFLTPEDEGEIVNKFMAGVSAVNAPGKDASDIAKEGVVFRRMDKAVNRIAEFNKTYGTPTNPNPFDKYVGPFDNPVFNAKAAAIPPQQMAAADLEARSIFRDVDFIIQGYRHKNFGSALTEQETKLFKEIVGNKRFSDYTRSLSDFRNSVKDNLFETVRQYKFAPNVDLEWRKMFYFNQPRSGSSAPMPAPSTAPSASTSTNSPSATGGQVFEFDVLPDGTVKRR